MVSRRYFRQLRAMKVIACISFLLAATSPFTALAVEPAFVTEQQLTEFWAGKDFVAPEQLPLFYARMKPYFERISQALEKRLIEVTHDTSIQITNDLLLIEKNPAINASVLPVKNADGTGYKGVILLTSGAINSFIRKGDPTSVAQGIMKLIGFSSHELAHWVDKLDPSGIEQNVGLNDGGQAIEFRTDYEGTGLLRHSDLPSDSLYQGLMSLYENVPPTIAKRVGQMTSSHPEKDTRLAAQRLSVTFDRVRAGFNDPIILTPEEANTLFSEVESISEHTLRFSVPKNLNDMIAQVQGPPHPKTRAQINAMVLWFDQMLAEGKLSTEDPDVIAMRKAIMSFAGMGMLCQTKRCLEEVFADAKIEGLERLKLVPHHVYLNSLPFYDSMPSEYADLLSAPEIRGNWENITAARSRFGAAGDVTVALSRRAILEVIKRMEIKDAFKLSQAFVELPNYAQQTQNSDDLLLYTHYFNTELAPRYYENASFQEPVTQFILGGVFRPTPTVSLTYLRMLVPTVATRTNWNDLFSRARSPKDLKMAQESLEAIWKNRGMWAYLEFMSELKFSMDWDFIGRRLGIPRERLANEIQRSFKQYLLDYAKRFKDSPEKLITDQTQLDFIEPKRPIWMTSKLDGFLESTVRSGGDSRLEKGLRQFWMGHYYRLFKTDLSQRLQLEIQKHFQTEGLPTTSDQVWAKLNEAEESITGFKDWSVRFLPDQIEVVLSALKSTGVSVEMIRAFEASALTWSRPHRFPDIETVNFTEATWKALYHSSKVRGDSIDVLDFVRKEKPNWQSNKDLSLYLPRFLEAAWVGLATDLIQEVKTMSLQRLNELSAEISVRFKPNEFHLSRELSEAMTARLKTLNSKPVEKLTAFWSMSKFARDVHTDTYFAKELIPLLKGARREKILRLALTDERIHNPKLRVEFSKELLGPEMSKTEVTALIGKIDALTRGDSNARDQWLEDIAWDRKVTGLDLENHIEQQKMTSWKKLNPKLASYSGYFSETVKVLSSQSKSELIDFLVSGGKDFHALDLAMKEVTTILRTGLEHLPPTYGGAAQFRAEAERKISDVRRQMILLATEATPIQRLPLVEFLLSTGETRVLANRSAVTELLRRHLGLLPYSVESSFLSAYLDILPEHERATHLSYVLLTSSGSEGKSANIASVLEAFGAVGVKFGQMAAQWDIFGPEYREQLENLFDRSTPMNKIEIEAALKKALTNKGYDDSVSALVKRLGSASIKTVALVELKSGVRAAVMVKRPFADTQTKTNLIMAKRFLDQLKKYALESPNPLFRPLIDALETQIGTELDFKVEAANYTKMQDIIQKLNETLRPGADGWLLNTPKVLTDITVTQDIFAVEAVDGISAKEFFKDPSVSALEKAQVGEMITRASLQMLFHHGVFDPDRHPGNWLIDRKTKTIHLIDLGQLTPFNTVRSPFSRDDRLKIAGFLKGLNDQDPKDILTYAKSMSATGSISASEEGKLKSSLEKVFSSGNAESEMLKKAVETLYSHGIQLDPKFTFGALKGIMVLSGKVTDESGYVSPDRFKQILSGEVKRLYQSKLPAVAPELISTAAKKGISNLKKMIKGPISCRSVFTQ